MEKLKKEIQSVVDIYKSRDLLKAKLLCEKLIIVNPKVAFLYNLMGLILTDQEKIQEAIECYEKGLKIDPNFAMIYNNLGLLFFNHKSNGNVKKAENYYLKSISLNKNIPEPHTNLGSLYNSLNKFEEAINCLKHAIHISPKFSHAHHNLGNIYVALGDFTKARIHFKESIKSDPNFYSSHRALSRLTKYTDNNEHFNELKKIYEQININDTEFKMNIGYSLGKAYEDIKDFEKSFAYYSESNLLYRKKINFSLDSEVRKFKEIKDIFNRNLYEKYPSSGYSKFSPIFIVGMPRSGTTLIEQILSSHHKVFGADEVEFLPKLMKKYFGNKNLNLFFKGVLDFNEKDFEKMGEEYAIKMKNYSNNSERITDKLPENFLRIGFIKLILPKSKIIHCYRNPMDTCLSVFKNHFPGGKIEFGYDLDDLFGFYNLYSDLMKYWNDLLPNFIFNIKYEKLISNTESEVRNLLKACQLEWSDECLNFYNNKRAIRTASDIQARNKIYKTSIDSWKNYQKHVNKYADKVKI